MAKWKDEGEDGIYETENTEEALITSGESNLENVRTEIGRLSVAPTDNQSNTLVLAEKGTLPALQIVDRSAQDPPQAAHFKDDRLAKEPSGKIVFKVEKLEPRYLTETERKNEAEDQLENKRLADKPSKSRQNETTLKIDIPRLQEQEFANVAKRVLANIDRGRKGYVTLKDVSTAIEDPSITGQEAQALVAMYQNFNKLSNIRNNEDGWSDRISPADLDRFDEIQAAEESRCIEAIRMNRWARSNLSRFDSDSSSSLSRQEIEQPLADDNTSKDDKIALQLIKKHYSNLGRFYESGVNQRALDDFLSNALDTKDRNEIGIFRSTALTASSQRHDINRNLYADKRNPLESITPDAIKQGSIGDCYFLAALGALAKSNPALIKDSIKDNGDSTYTVTFPGARDEPITIKAPSEAEQGLYNHGSTHGLWASVMEKAYGEYCQKHFWRRSPLNLSGGNTPTDGADGGGRPESSTWLLTGNSTDTDLLLFTSQATTAEKLEKAFSSNPPKSVTATINGGLFSSITEDNFYTGHAYSIIGFTPDGKGGGMVTVRNPWGSGDGTSGTITAPLEKFMRNFSSIIYEQ